MKQLIIVDEDDKEKFSKYLSDNSEVSSLFESEDSIEDTSKYIYVEDLEYQAIIKKSEQSRREDYERINQSKSEFGETINSTAENQVKSKEDFEIKN